MDNQYYQKHIDRIPRLLEKSIEKQLSFFQHILIVSSGTFGIIISLHSNSSSGLNTRLVFLLAVLTLSLGSLLTAFVLYDLSFLAERGRQAYCTEVQSAITERRFVQAVAGSKRKRTVFCEKACCILLLFSIVLLSLWAVLAVIG